MAKKGQKFKKYPNKLKLEVVSKALRGRGYKSIGREYHLCYYFVSDNELIRYM